MTVIYCDGGCIVGTGLGAHSIVVVKNDKILSIHGKVIKKDGLTNNQAEYNAILYALTIGTSDGYIDIVSDSEVVIKQINGEYKVKNDNLIRLHALVTSLIKNSEIEYTFRNAPRENKYIQIADKTNKILMNI